jgi:glucokinase-like ROK family protein
MITKIKKATRAQTKSHNKSLILKTIYDHGQISRADVARFTRLTRPTVSSTVTELIDEGLVGEVGQGPSEGGKPPILLSVIDDSRQLIGIDLANSEFRGAVINLRGKIIHRHSLPVNEVDGAAALQLVYALVDDLIAAATNPLLGIGIGTPGLMNPQLGVVRKAVNLDWQDLPLRQMLEERIQLPIYIANDGQVAALGEFTFGRSRRSANLVVVKAGRGVGAGIVANGQLFYGDGFGAGEIGHVRVVENGKLCRCGNTGCLETVVSSRALIGFAKEVMEQNPDSPLHSFVATPANLTTDAILLAFQAGDVELRRFVVDMGRYLGKAVANLVGILNIKQIVIGGSLARFGETLIEPIRQEMRLRVQSTQADETEITGATLGTDIVIFGAAALLLTNELALV